MGRKQKNYKLIFSAQKNVPIFRHKFIFKDLLDTVRNRFDFREIEITEIEL